MVGIRILEIEVLGIQSLGVEMSRFEGLRRKMVGVQMLETFCWEFRF